MRGRPIVVMENELVPLEVESSCARLDRTAAESAKQGPGCDNILLNLSAVPTGELYACCGLTMTQIPELVVGTLEQLAAVGSADELSELLLSNFLWPWLCVEGPDGLARIVEDEIGCQLVTEKMRHRCHQCLALFSHPLRRSILAEQAAAQEPLLLSYLQREHLMCQVFK